MNDIKPKNIVKEKIKNKLAEIEKLVLHYETRMTIEERDKFEVLIEDRFEQLSNEIKYEFVQYTKGILPYKYTSLKEKYIEIKKQKQFFGFPCVRCSSRENITYYAGTRKMHSRSEIITLHQQRVTYQYFVFDFPVCTTCRKKIIRLKVLNILMLVLLIGWPVGFGVMGMFMANILTNDVLPYSLLIIAAVGGLGFLIGKIALRSFRFIKIKVKFRGYNAPRRGKNYECNPMVKPLTSEKWISYEEWLKSL